MPFNSNNIKITLKIKSLLCFNDRENSPSHSHYITLCKYGLLGTLLQEHISLYGNITHTDVSTSCLAVRNYLTVLSMFIMHMQRRPRKTLTDEAKQRRRNQRVNIGPGFMASIQQLWKHSFKTSSQPSVSAEGRS